MSLEFEESLIIHKLNLFNPYCSFHIYYSTFSERKGTKNDFVQPINVQFRCKKRRIHEQNTKVFTSGEVLRMRISQPWENNK